MQIVDAFERKFARYIPERLTNILVFGQAIAFLLIYTRPDYVTFFSLSGSDLFKGEIWRIVTLLFAPPASGLLFILLALYFFYMFGNMLENEWGSARYLFYILLSVLGILVFSLLFPQARVSNFYLYSSLFLAFAYLHPDFRVLLFFIIPVKMKWLGLLAWIGIVISFLTEPLGGKLLILFSLCNFFFFFVSDLRYFFKGHVFKMSGNLSKAKPYHVCAVCGKNEIDNPDMEIRYCGKCYPNTCYCGEHILKHQHKRAVN